MASHSIPVSLLSGLPGSRRTTCRRKQRDTANPSQISGHTVQLQVDARDLSIQNTTGMTCPPMLSGHVPDSWDTEHTRGAREATMKLASPLHLPLSNYEQSFRRTK